MPAEPGTGQQRQVSLLAEGRRWIGAELRADGTLVIEGQDLDPPAGLGGGEYEWTITVRPGDVPTVVRALGGQSGDDVLDLLSRHRDEVVGTGELTWLHGIGLHPDFWSRIGD